MLAKRRSLGAADDHSWVNEHPEAERAALLSDALPFDALSAQAAPDVGTLAEVFRTYPGTVVSDHPEARVAAYGTRAHELLDDVPWDDYFGPGSPLERSLDGGRVLRLGADMNTVTVLHHAENRCSVWPVRRVRRHRLVSAPDGPTIRTVECVDDENGLVDYPGEDYFEDLLRDYLATGRARTGRVGDAAAELFEARKRRSAAEAVAIGSLKSALANAEAVPVGDRPYQVMEGRADVPRRVLGAGDIAAIVRAEIDERRGAIRDLSGWAHPPTSCERRSPRSSATAARPGSRAPP